MTQRPATLEVLFAAAGQEKAFLLLAAGGVALGLMLQLAELLRRANRLAGAAADVVFALAAAGMVLAAALLTGSGFRLYALLGLLVGLALYRAGIQPLTEAALRAVGRRGK